MSKFFKIFLIFVFFGSVGYLINKYFSPTSKDQLGGPTVEAQFCSTDSHVCLPIPQNPNSGTLKIKITTGGKSVRNLEVDVASKPGANEYYMMLTDVSGAVTLNWLPPGMYSIYFNNNDFPTQYGVPPVVPVEITIGQTTQKTVDLTSK
ncbi:MAG: hypothetical protein UV71_C0012G0042 [Microgenomates group bacterium GW2011_GWC1_43_13]|uniref:Uncharacterized protein n=3 Tax=Candidatus Woeseibacteriota TaxID=1752722 RepID=A0A837I8J6_9BACT|nr:MAG: hypothetical protein UV71_C0012G0042 [Microgenomates group bacterium GW2011_GWC1_43_13]KKT33125.1 MAG: hypothetical protein UW20_C0005G0057 [Candidatus Woesebacteria bacterium GW2011_GWB1_44_11]KKT53684.1 MAG: hypothetical protein UW47_C0021G0006 [Candidatus Woesebacteria bacterium GW2011_GWA1_44_23]OGM88069.1 MAG: hypothetical protein A2573_01015 [Candidatus Woesebacteria bacterium RIFOXYD1_FULL_43_18]